MPKHKYFNEMENGMANHNMSQIDMPNVGIMPRAFVIDQPYIGLLQLTDGFNRGTVFPNIILPQRKVDF